MVARALLLVPTKEVSSCTVQRTYYYFSFWRDLYCEFFNDVEDTVRNTLIWQLLCSVDTDTNITAVVIL